MVLKKRLDYGFNGFQVPVIPRAPRSVRRRGLFKKKIEDNQICAFELLATVAGKLLLETESSSASSNEAEVKDQLVVGIDAIKQEQQDDERLLKTECLDQESCEESVSVSELVSQEHNQKFILKEFPHAESDALLERTSIVTNSDCSGKFGSDMKLSICKSKNVFGKFPSKVKRGFPGIGESCDGNLDNGIRRQLEAEGEEMGGLTVADTCSLQDPVEICMNFPAPVNSDCKVKLPLCRDPIPNASFHKHRNDVKVVNRDDDENSSGCNQRSTKVKAFRPSPRIADRRIRKLLTSKYWKVAPKLKDYDISNTDCGIKPACRNRKTYYGRERYQRDTPFKKRKWFDKSSVVTSDGGVSSESISNSPEKGMSGDKSGSDALLHGANGISSTVRGHQASFHSRDSHVRLSIKSFRVPELFIEVPESATVGSLKSTVMEAVTAILSRGLHVGVLLRGKKVSDDDRTLLQTGISQNDNLDTLGFTLEPNLAQAPSPLCPEDPPFLIPCDTPQRSTRSTVTPLLDSGVSDASPDPSPVSNLNNHVESNYDLVPSPSDVLIGKTTPETKALVAVPAMNVEALAVVPMNQKIRRSELAQRRTRRPFSVSEVEALVHAVEKLGTGRWRDVKIRSFDNANHRTYVDLKDKWKTLVHTAQISPQQRRGEPVPQELLDRVLSAHSYWSQHQAKQHGKHQAGTLKITEGQAEEDGSLKEEVI
ncbi:hypothetical protein L1049_011157 [Liquidambar formosana]|uniref:Uncharacterized protein n=1 Tax=Liquidambar formosana TaxID=63359 RepID=A0AAP0RUW5_LIQFO